LVYVCYTFFEALSGEAIRAPHSQPVALYIPGFYPCSTCCLAFLRIAMVEVFHPRYDRAVYHLLAMQVCCFTFSIMALFYDAVLIGDVYQVFSNTFHTPIGIALWMRVAGVSAGLVAIVVMLAARPMYVVPSVPGRRGLRASLVETQSSPVTAKIVVEMRMYAWACLIWCVLSAALDLARVWVFDSTPVSLSILLYPARIVSVSKASRAVWLTGGGQSLYRLSVCVVVCVYIVMASLSVTLSGFSGGVPQSSIWEGVIPSLEPVNNSWYASINGTVPGLCTNLTGPAVQYSTATSSCSVDYISGDLQQAWQACLSWQPFPPDMPEAEAAEVIRLLSECDPPRAAWYAVLMAQQQETRVWWLASHRTSDAIPEAWSVRSVLDAMNWPADAVNAPPSVEISANNNAELNNNVVADTCGLPSSQVQLSPVGNAAWNTLMGTLDGPGTQDGGTANQWQSVAPSMDIWSSSPGCVQYAVRAWMVWSGACGDSEDQFTWWSPVRTWLALGLLGGCCVAPLWAGSLGVGYGTAGDRRSGLVFGVLLALLAIAAIQVNVQRIVSPDMAPGWPLLIVTCVYGFLGCVVLSGCIGIAPPQSVTRLVASCMAFAWPWRAIYIDVVPWRAIETDIYRDERKVWRLIAVSFDAIGLVWWLFALLSRCGPRPKPRYMDVADTDYSSDEDGEDERDDEEEETSSAYSTDTPSLWQAAGSVLRGQFGARVSRPIQRVPTKNTAR
jgi:hypothetical protein